MLSAGANPVCVQGSPASPIHILLWVPAIHVLHQQVYRMVELICFMTLPSVVPLSTALIKQREPPQLARSEVNG